MTRQISLRRPRQFIAALPALLLFASASAFAAPIGNATLVKPQASLETLSGTISLVSGGRVEANNRVITGPAGEARLRFLDASLLEVGSNAAVTLDEFVYDGRQASKAALTMTLGAFRWVSGASPKEAYDLKTPLATIGVRGTELTVETSAERTTIRLRAGAVLACSRISSACATLNRNGQGVHIDADGRVEPFEERAQQPPLMMQRAARPPRSGPPPRTRTAQQQRSAPAITRAAQQRMVRRGPSSETAIVVTVPRRFEPPRQRVSPRPAQRLPRQRGSEPPVLKPR